MFIYFPNLTHPLLRLLVQIVTIRRTHQTVESVPKRPEKYWQEDLHTGKVYADIQHSLCEITSQLCAFSSNLVEKS